MGNAVLGSKGQNVTHEDELNASAWRELVELTSEWFWEQDEQFRFTRFFGSTPEKMSSAQSEFIGQRRWEVPRFGVSVDKLAEHIAACEHHLPFRQFQYCALGVDNTLQYYEVSGIPIFDEHQKFIGYRGVGRNITDLRDAEKQLEHQSLALQSAYAEMEDKVRERTHELSQQLHFLHQLIDAIPGPVFYKDTEGRYLGCNRAFEDFIGYPVSEIIGKTLPELISQGLSEKNIALDQDLLEKNDTKIYERRVSFADGEVRHVMVHKATYTHADGSVGGVVGVMLDITERKRLEETLRQAATVFESSAEGVIIARPDNSIIAVNRAFSEITGYDEKEVVDRNPRLLQSGHHDQLFYKNLWINLSRDGRWSGEIWNRRKNGEVYPEWLSIAAVHDQEGRLTNYVATFADITLQKEAEEKIQTLAFSDALTGLPNRRLLLNRLQKAIAASLRSGRHGALFFIDLDGFKNLNDTRGHDKGDLLLKQVAKRLVDNVRDADTVARLGGDEFVVLLEGLSEVIQDATHHTESVGAKILAALNEPYEFEDFSCHSTPSIGVTLFGDCAMSIDDLMKQADLAMYRAKDSGRNALRFFDPEMQSAVTARVALEADLYQGLQTNQFVMYYQPQLDHLGNLIGAEALIRWLHPTRGLVLPNEFISLVEETGLILPIGSWVLETACRQLKQWQENPHAAHLKMAVNISARQCFQSDFCEHVLAILSATRVDPHGLTLELTESVLLDNIENIIFKMNLLKEKGVCFALDDFGTGYSSLSYLKRLPLDQLKIDRSFVHDVLTDANDAVIARTVVALAHSLGLSVIAEGVETEEQLHFLIEHGCYAYQGYLFSPPLPILQFEKLIPWRDR